MRIDDSANNTFSGKTRLWIDIYASGRHRTMCNNINVATIKVLRVLVFLVLVAVIHTLLSAHTVVFYQPNPRFHDGFISLETIAPDEIDIVSAHHNVKLSTFADDEDPNRLKMLQEWNDQIRAMLPNLTAECQQFMTLTPLRPDQHDTHCPCFTNRNRGYVPVDLSPPDWDEMVEKFNKSGRLAAGGEWQPEAGACVPRQRVAVIVPYRARLVHLHVLINHLHTVLTRQNMHYRIFIIEQAYPVIFNRAALIDIGFLEALKVFPFDCAIFHDVDRLPEDDRNLYACVRDPRHMAHSVDNNGYIGPYYPTFFGGINAFLRRTFEQVNGMSTQYWGWGGEDDDLYKRVKTHGLYVDMQNNVVARTTSIRHGRDRKNPENIFKDNFIHMNDSNFTALSTVDGLSSIQYKVYKSELRPLFTWLSVEPLSVLSGFLYQEMGCEAGEQYFSIKLSLMACAVRCDHDPKCGYFWFSFDQSKCVILYEKCDRVMLSNSYLFTKGRTIDGKMFSNYSYFV